MKKEKKKITSGPGFLAMMLKYFAELVSYAKHSIIVVCMSHSLKIDLAYMKHH